MARGLLHRSSDSRCVVSRAARPRRRNRRQRCRAPADRRARSAVMPGVSIVARNTATNQERSGVVTDAAGQHATAALAPGHYRGRRRTSRGFIDQKRELDLSVRGPDRRG